MHHYSLTAENVPETPYITMDKVASLTLWEAVEGGLDRNGVYRALEGLATFRKCLQQHPFPSIGALYLDATGDASSKKHHPSEEEYQAPQFVELLGILDREP